jgi:hypothetical protein
MLLSAYSAFRHCDFDAAAEYLAPVVMGMIVGVFAGVLGVGAGIAAKRLFGGAKKLDKAAAQDALRGEERALQRAATAAIHGNSRASGRLTYLYALHNRKTGAFLKWGVTSAMDPYTRYPRRLHKDVEMTILDKGTRTDMLDLERWLEERLPGPWNHVTWAGSKASDVPWFITPLAR